MAEEKRKQLRGLIRSGKAVGVKVVKVEPEKGLECCQEHPRELLILVEYVGKNLS